MQPSFLIENNYPNLFVAGIDEAGRGPLAGPVVAACVILDRGDFSDGNNCEINDSKKLSKLRRKKIFFELKNKAKFGVGIVDEKIIDEIKIQRVLFRVFSLVRRCLVLFSYNNRFYCLCNYLVVILSYYGSKQFLLHST